MLIVSPGPRQEHRVLYRETHLAKSRLTAKLSVNGPIILQFCESLKHSKVNKSGLADMNHVEMFVSMCLQEPACLFAARSKATLKTVRNLR